MGAAGGMGSRLLRAVASTWANRTIARRVLTGLHLSCQHTHAVPGNHTHSADAGRVPALAIGPGMDDVHLHRLLARPRVEGRGWQAATSISRSVRIPDQRQFPQRAHRRRRPGVWLARLSVGALLAESEMG